MVCRLTKENYVKLICNLTQSKIQRPIFDGVTKIQLDFTFVNKQSILIR
jgi:hypothetical protein